MTKLLISVRSAEEAEIALAEGADLIDVKEPSRGSLGAADVKTIAAIIERVAGRVPLSVALGELLEAGSLPASMGGQLRYAKFGLAGCGPRADWPTRWQQAIDALPQGITPVAVAYADWKTSLAPSPSSVLMHAKPSGCGAVLVDTCDKSQGSLLEHWSLAELARFIAAAQRSELVSAVAGSLDWATIEEVLSLAPDYIAVRGCVCAGDRTSRLDRARVRRLTALVRQTRQHVSPVELT